VGSSGTTVLELIVAGDVDAAAGFYDGRAPSVREYFTRLCRPESVDEATLAAFVDLRGRAANAPPDADADDILSRAARTAAAGRLELRDERWAECRATVELLVARMNGELVRGEAPLERHLKRCSSCRQTAERLASADAALSSAGGEAPPNQIRASWLELVGREPAPEQPVTAEPAPVPPAPEPAPAEPAQAPSRPTRARARRGGLIGAARRLASSQRRHQ
jgi:hypothetical protein